MKKCTILTILLLSTVLISKGQDIRQFYLYAYNHALFNPAAGGESGRHNIAINGQLNHFSNDYTFHNNFTQGTLCYDGNIKKLHSGIGAIGYYSLGATTFKKASLIYSYKLLLNSKTTLSIGVRPTVSKEVIDFSKFQAINPDDPLLRDDKLKLVEPDLDLGIWYNSDGYYGGIALNNVFKHVYNYGDDLKGTDFFGYRSLTIMGGKKIDLPINYYRPIHFLD